jgi:hypothetical protein
MLIKKRLPWPAEKRVNIVLEQPGFARALLSSPLVRGLYPLGPNDSAIVGFLIRPEVWIASGAGPYRKNRANREFVSGASAVFAK